MSWEAYRWTAKTPSELYHTLGPHGVDHLVRQSLDATWRELPEDARNLEAAKRAAAEVFDRNIRVWRAIKKATPEAFFADLLPKQQDQYLRQAMLVCWMMMPRTGGREPSAVIKIITRIHDRNLAAWEEDEATLKGTKPKKPGKPRAAPKGKVGGKKKAPVKKSKTAAKK